jgi:hypothetical protein
LPETATRATEWRSWSFEMTPSLTRLVNMLTCAARVGALLDTVCTPAPPKAKVMPDGSTD